MAKSSKPARRLSHADPVQRKLQFVRNALKRYYNVWNFPMKLDAETAMMSTEIGILHYFIGRVLVQDKCLDAEARIVDCMAGAGTISLCLALHLPRAELHALEIDAARVVLLEHNLMQAGKAVAEPKHESGISVGNSEPELNLMQAGKAVGKAEAEHEHEPDKSVGNSEPEHNNANPPSATEDASLEQMHAARVVLPEHNLMQADKVVKNAEAEPEPGTNDPSHEPGPLTPAAARLSPPPRLPGSRTAHWADFFTFFADKPTDWADVLIFAPSWSEQERPSLVDILDFLAGPDAPHARCIVIKVAPGTELAPERLAFCTRATQHAIHFYDRHAFDFLVLDTCVEPASLSASFESIQHRVRGATAVPLQLRRTTARPRCGMYTPPPAERRLSSAPDVAQINYAIQHRTHVDDSSGATVWTGAAPAGLEIHALDLECRAAAAAAAKQLFAWLRAERPPGFVERIGRSQWPWRSEAETLRHGDVLTVEQCKGVLGHKFPILHNVVTDLEHVVRRLVGVVGSGAGSMYFMQLEPGSGVALQLETRVQPGDAVFWLPVVGDVALDMVPTLAPEVAGEQGVQLRVDVEAGSVCWRRGDALQRWAFGVPFGEGVGVGRGAGGVKVVLVYVVRGVGCLV